MASAGVVTSLFGQHHHGYLAGSAVLVVAVFVLVARWTRDRGRVGRALVGGSVAALVNLGLDAIAHRLGWWEYTDISTPFGPLSYYALVAVGMAAFALVGLRVRDRFGVPGVLAMTLSLGVYGIVRDHRLADRYGLMAFDNSVGVAIMDGLFEWVIPFVVAIVTCEAISRPPVAALS